MTHRDLQKNSARDGGSSGRPTREDSPSMAIPTIPDPEILEAADDGRLVDLAMYRALHGSAREIDHHDPPIDAVAREQAEGKIGQLHTKVSEAEVVLSWLAGFVGGGPGIAAINSAGIKLGEVREQLPALRQAVRDMEGQS